MKYKVGDKVRIRKDLEIGKRYGSKLMIDCIAMKEARGKEAIITEVWESDNSYKINNLLCWSEEMIEGKANTMKATLTVDGKEIEVEITEEEIKKLNSKKKTGYERVEKDEEYFIEDDYGMIANSNEDFDCFDDIHYQSANYYTDEQLTRDCARADKLLRQLRRFAVEHRKEELDWENTDKDKYYIYYNYGDNAFNVSFCVLAKDLGQIYFDSGATAELAIETFKDELEWYFTEFKDSL